jgi:hypothetical protein
MVGLSVDSSNDASARPLLLFNEKAQKLMESEFIDYVRKHRLSFELHASKDSVKTTLSGPSQTAIDAFALTLRFFIQEREESSFRKLAKTYDTLPISVRLKQEYENIRESVNRLLDSNSKVKIMNLTRRDIIWNIMYGELAHSESAKSKVVEEWKKDQVVWGMIQFEFQSSLLDLLQLIQATRELNNEALMEMSHKPDR